MKPAPHEPEDWPEELRLDTGPWVLRVVDLKQWAYCPRIVYFTYTLPVQRPTPFRLDEGTRVHDHLQARWRRRGLPRQLPAGEVQWEVPLWAPELGLSGKVDVLILPDAQHAIPVDIKHARRAFPGWKVQLAAYAWLVEHLHQRRVPEGYLYLARVRRAERVRITPALRARVRQTVAAMQQAVLHHAMPPPTRQRGRCVNCEFRRFCNDIF